MERTWVAVVAGKDDAKKEKRTVSRDDYEV